MTVVNDRQVTHLVGGFTQTASSWDGVVAALPESCGGSVVDIPMRTSFPATASALADAGQGSWVGYSMGGRLTLRLALDHPDVVQRLVLVSTTAGLEDASARAERLAQDEVRASQIERDGVEAFLEAWLAQPLFAGVPPDAPGVTDRRSIDPEVLTHQLRVLGTGRMAPLWDRLDELNVPVLVVTGEADPKFEALGDRLAAGIADVERRRLAGGHALLLEAPTALAELVAEFVGR